MSRRQRTHTARSRIAGPNPFVAFSDITIAMAFIFAMSSMALSKALSDATREDNQKRVQASAVRLFAPNAKPLDIPAAEHQRRTKPQAVMVGDRKVGRIESDGSFQRIRMFGGYAVGSDAMNPQTVKIFRDVVQMAGDEMRAGHVKYILLQGGSSDREHYSADLAQRRVAKAVKLLAGLIAEDADDAKRTGRIDPQYMIPYSSGRLYAEGESQDAVNAAGRVDVVLYFNDGNDR